VIGPKSLLPEEGGEEGGEERGEEGGEEGSTAGGVKGGLTSLATAVRHQLVCGGYDQVSESMHVGGESQRSLCSLYPVCAPHLH
jgi:hypothetical protein